MITAALRRELRPLRRALSIEFQTVQALSIDFYKTAIGNKFNPAAFRQQLRQEPYLLVLNFGTVGALTDELRPLMLFLPKSFINSVGNEIKCSESEQEWFQHLKSAAPHWRVGWLYTAETPVIDRWERGQIGRDFRSLAVDMEAYHLAQLCQEQNVPFISLKVITDRADSNTESDFNENFEQAITKLTAGALILIRAFSGCRNRDQ